MLCRVFSKHTYRLLHCDLISLCLKDFVNIVVYLLLLVYQLHHKLHIGNCI